MTDATGGWENSARAWIDEQGEHGDFGRRYVLDPPMIDRLTRRPYATALDVGCGEGRFCRIMQRHGIRTIGIDPAASLLARARQLDPAGDYRQQRAETLDLPAASVDLVVSYLTLIDIPDIPAALARMVAVLRPGGTLLIANLNGFFTAGLPAGWTPDETGEPAFRIDHYLDERPIRAAWRGIDVDNWHRPFSFYLTLLLGHDLTLTHFAEPLPTPDAPTKSTQYRRVPYFHLMEWTKPLAE